MGIRPHKPGVSLEVSCFLQKFILLCELVEEKIQIKTALYNDVHNPLFILEMAIDHQELGAKDLLPVFIEDGGPGDQVDGAGLIFDGDKAGAFGGAGSLTDQNAAGDMDIFSITAFGQLAGGNIVEGFEVFAQETDRMCLEG